MVLSKLKYVGNPGKVKNKAREYKYNFQKEFHLHKCLLHHYDVIDFTVFEFGFRVIYLPYRLCCAFLIPLLVLTLHEELSEVEDFATPHASLAYMHLWLFILLAVQAAVDVVALTWSIMKYPTCDLVNLRWMPVCFQVLWVVHNVVFPNMLATAFMYSAVFGMSKVIGTDYYLMLAFSFYAGVHIGVCGVPTRIAHFLHPIALIVAYLFFTAMYTGAGGTDPKGNAYVYKEMDWDSKIDSALIALLWIAATVFFHLSMVLGTWTKRKIFRRLRKGKEAVTNPDPDDDSSICSLDEDGLYLNDLPEEPPRIWIEDVPNDAQGHKRVIVESPRPRGSNTHSNVYHEVLDGPQTPGERRKRLVVGDPSDCGVNRVCFSASGREIREFPRRPSGEMSFICHPEYASVDGRLVYTCMPDNKPGAHRCVACNDERSHDRTDLNYPNGFGHNQDPKAFSFELHHNNPRQQWANSMHGPQPIQTQPFECPRNECEEKRRKSLPLPPPTSKPSRAYAPKYADSEGSVCEGSNHSSSTQQHKPPPKKTFCEKVKGKCKKKDKNQSEAGSNPAKSKSDSSVAPDMKESERLSTSPPGEESNQRRSQSERRFTSNSHPGNAYAPAPQLVPVPVFDDTMYSDQPENHTQGPRESRMQSVRSGSHPGSIYVPATQSAPAFDRRSTMNSTLSHQPLQPNHGPRQSRIQSVRSQPGSVFVPAVTKPAPSYNDTDRRSTVNSNLSQYPLQPHQGSRQSRIQSVQSHPGSVFVPAAQSAPALGDTDRRSTVNSNVPQYPMQPTQGPRQSGLSVRPGSQTGSVFVPVAQPTSAVGDPYRRSTVNSTLAQYPLQQVHGSTHSRASSMRSRSQPGSIYVPTTQPPPASGDSGRRSTVKSNLSQYPMQPVQGSRHSRAQSIRSNQSGQPSRTSVNPYDPSLYTALPPEQETRGTMSQPYRSSVQSAPGAESAPMPPVAQTPVRQVAPWGQYPTPQL